MIEEAVTISTVYIKPNAVEPTQDSTKVFTPRVDTATDRETAQESTPRKPVRTEVRPAANPRRSATFGVCYMCTSVSNLT